MNIREYIDTGILELYCLGALSPQEMEEVQHMMTMHTEVKNEIDSIQAAMETYTQKYAVTPPAHLEHAIGNLLDNLSKEAQMQLADLPLINKFTNYRRWLDFVQDRIPSSFKEGRYTKVLTSRPSVLQMLIVSATDIEDEVHTNELESFIILEGQCDCMVGDKVFRMVAGDFMQIPLHEHHEVKILTPYVVAILQRLTLAA
jgi:mannose-6-phosphate isomerase-like protein (cupin superfamily)